MLLEFHFRRSLSILCKSAKLQNIYLTPSGPAHLGAALVSQEDLGSKNYQEQKMLRILF
jgi:hypothetical protein